MNDSPTIHASAVLVGRKAVLIRGPAGAGKSRLAWQLLQAADDDHLSFARLVADDRCYIEACAGRVLVRPHPALAGLIEIRSLGIRRLGCEPIAVVGLVVDLVADDAARYPSDKESWVEIAGIRLSRLPVAAGIDPLPPVLAFLTTAAAGD